MNKPLFLLILISSWSYNSAIKLETLKKCCNLGTNYANSGLKCSSFQTPIAGIAEEDQSRCLNSVDMCCKNQNRQKQCELGQKDAQLETGCVDDASDESAFRTECCEACEMGLQTGISGQSCKSELGLGSLMDSAFESCCVQKQDATTSKSSSVSTSASTSTAATTTKTTTTTTAAPTTLSAILPKFTKSLEKYNDNNPRQSPTLEALCEIPELCAHICIPTKGSFECACYEGFTLMADKISCKPNKRSSPNSQRCAINNPCDHECIDTGVAIKCACYEGYELANDKKTCKDIDECALEIDDCMSNEICVNLEGDYECQMIDNSSELENVGFDDKCPEGYKFDGERMVCDDIDECEIGLVCPKPGTCVNTIGSFKCEDDTPQCPPGFHFKESIQKCDDIDECLSGEDDCNRESQVCLNTKGNYTCIDKASTRTCPPGFKKNLYTQQCEDIDECLENPTLCSDNEECVNEPGGHNCIPKKQSSSTLRTQYTTPSTTPYSQTSTIRTTPTHHSTSQLPNKPEPRPNYPRPEEVQPNSQSFYPNRYPTPAINKPLYQPPRITCSTGYAYSEQTNSCIDVDECKSDSSVCDSNQDCYNTAGSFICNCKSGFTKDYQTGACVDINECQIGKDDCSDWQRCDNTIGSFICSRPTGCGTGYTLNSATGLCEDDDECKLGLHNCHDLGSKFQCRNTLGSYRCERIRCIGDCVVKQVFTSTTNFIPIRIEPTKNYPIISGQLKKCLPGYKMNAQGICEDVNECENNPCKKGEKCLNLNGRYQCIAYMQCNLGYELNPEGSACIDINECSRGTHKCKSGQICKNTPGYYICLCPPGHKLNPGNECEDINECDMYRNRICSRNAQCINTIGSYKCKCKEGFRETGDACDDIDECAENPNRCQQNCINLWGSYRCSCDRGFILGSDNRTCTDVNECDKFRDKNLCVGVCQNTPGSYTCSCPEGYRLGADGRTCQDIDECLTNICPNPEDICVNTRGAHKCHTINCPPNYIKDPDHKSRCKRASNVCDIRDTNCIRMPGQYSYHFVTFVSNLPIPEEGRIDFFQMKGPHWPSSSANFNMNTINVRCPRNVRRADESYFRMKRDSNKVVVALVKPIEGPQEIELQLQMELFITGIYQGKVISTVFIYVSEYEF